MLGLRAMGEIETSALLVRLKTLIVQRLKLERSPETIQDDELLFDPNGLGLDSIDALELVLAIEQEFGVRIENEEVGSEVMATPARLAGFLESRAANRSSS